MDRVTSVPVSVNVGDEPESNPSANPWFGDILADRLSRRRAIGGGVATAVGLAVAGDALAHGKGYGKGHGKGHDRDHDFRRPLSPGFTPVPHSTADAVIVPEGYSVQVLTRKRRAARMRRETIGRSRTRSARSSPRMA